MSVHAPDSARTQDAAQDPTSKLGRPRPSVIRTCGVTTAWGFLRLEAISLDDGVVVGLKVTVRS